MKFIKILTINLIIIIFLIFILNYILIKNPWMFTSNHFGRSSDWSEITDFIKKQVWLSNKKVTVEKETKEIEVDLNSSELNAQELNKIFRQNNENIQENVTESISPDFIKIINNEESLNKFCEEERIIFGKEYTNNPIIIYGCSYAYGHGLKSEDSFPSLLSNITKRPVISMARCGFNEFDNLAELQRFYEINEENKELVKNADYVIYLYMFDHIHRFIQPYTLLDHYNTIFDTSFAEKQLSKIYLFRLVFSKIRLNKILKGYPYSESISNYMKYCIKRIQKKTKLLTPNAKFINILYDETVLPYRESLYQENTWYYMNAPLWDELNKEEDMINIHTKDIMGFYFNNNYRLKQDITLNPHPNEKVWKEFTPKFAEKYIQTD